jgi:hypothetical protein
MFGDGFKEGDSPENHIKETSSAAFKAHFRNLYTDITEVDDAVLFDLVKLCDQYQVERASVQPLFAPVIHKHHCPQRSHALGAGVHREW